ncbi:hypothetical protein [Parasitella parasitica]|uniref:Uncharacterized protein n=1 Tax=Parasitella parasitica TaxID=35722 RepID=A0A0B7NMA7_9FUNG|nr:hypothetical protein [Parasitella parasitica]
MMPINITLTLGSLFSGLVPPTLIFQDTLDTIVKSKCPIAYKDLTICKRGCMVLKNKTDQCPNKDCTSSSKQTKQRTVRLLDLGFQISRMLCNPVTENLMRYPTDDFVFQEGCSSDYFSGQEYQMLSKSSACENSDLNIFVALFIDGFVNSNVFRDSKFTLIHALVLNLPPSHRFQAENMIQLAILNTQGPLNIDSYVDCILNDIKAISENGMRVLKNGQEIFKKVTVHLWMFFGIKSSSPFTRLNTYCLSFHALDEFHLLSGIGVFLVELLSTNSVKNLKNNTCAKYMYHPTEEDLEERDLSDANDWPFPFYISSTYLKEIAELVEISRSTIPTSHFE